MTPKFAHRDSFVGGPSTPRVLSQSLLTRPPRKTNRGCPTSAWSSAQSLGDGTSRARLGCRRWRTLTIQPAGLLGRAGGLVARRGASDELRTAEGEDPGRQGLEGVVVRDLAGRVRFRERSAAPLAHPDSSEAADSLGVGGPSVWTTVGGAERSTWARFSASGAREHSISQ
jgi:hypothetical protein